MFQRPNTPFSTQFIILEWRLLVHKQLVLSLPQDMVENKTVLLYFFMKCIFVEHLFIYWKCWMLSENGFYLNSSLISTGYPSFYTLNCTVLHYIELYGTVYTELHVRYCTTVNCTVLYTLNCTVLHFTELYWTVRYCIHWTVQYCTTLNCTVLYTLNCTVLHCTELYGIALH